MNTLKLAAAFFSVFVIVSSFTCHSARANRVQIILADGTPAANAKAIIRKSSRRDAPSEEVSQTTHTADEKGWLEIPFEFEHGFNSVMIVYAKDAAIGVWNYPGGERLQLAKKFNVTGRAVTLDGKPVSNAKVQVVHFGLHTYMHIYSELLRDVDGFCTNTDADGLFELPGATLNGYEFPPGAILWVKGEFEGRTFTGEGFQSYVGNLKVEDYFDVDRDKEPIAMHPVSTVSGRVINAATGDALPSATITYNSVHDIDGEPVITDEDGRFSIENLPGYKKRRFRIRHELLAEPLNVSELSYPNQTDPDVDGLVFQAWPAQQTSGKVVDEITGEPTLIPLQIDYQQISELPEGWQSVSSGTFDCVGIAGHTSTDGTFTVNIPSGEVELRFSPRHSNRTGPYDQTWKFDLKPGENDIGTLSLPRRKGLFCKMVLAEPPANERTFWESVTIITRLAGSPSYSYAQSGTYWFYPVKEWGDKVEIEIYQRDENSNRTTLLTPTTFTANEMAWPTEIEIKPLN